MYRKVIRDTFLTDEVALFEDASRFIGSDLTQNKLAEITSSQGVSCATAVLYQHITNLNKKFIETVNSYPKAFATPFQPTKIIVIPGMFYKEHPDIGGDGSLVRSIAEKFGFITELVEIHSRGSISENKTIILKKLLENKHNNVWLVSLSKGSTEVRLALEELRGRNVTKNIKGWVSIVGLTKGTPHADKKLRNRTAKIIWYLTLKVLGVNTAVTEEIACKNESLKKDFLLDSHIKIIHIAGFPLPSHVEPLLVKRYKILAHIGPNDGMIFLRDLLFVPGNVYPIWGIDHFLRTSNISEIIYKICHYINNSK